MKLEIAADLTGYKYGLLSAKRTLTYLGDDIGMCHALIPTKRQTENHLGSIAR